MTHDFEIVDEITLAATPEEVWQAIATGPGVDSWFMGRAEIEAGVGGAHRIDLTAAMGVELQSTITSWQPGRRLAFREDSADGTFSATEYLLAGRDGGSTTLRFAHNGILNGDDWEDQYEGMRAGDRMFLEQLAVYLRYFPGREATRNLFLFGPTVTDTARVWSRFADALSLTGPTVVGAPTRLDVRGLPTIDGEVAFVDEPHFLGVRTLNGIHLFVQGYRDILVVGYHGFSDNENVDQLEAAWRSWLAEAA